MFSQAQPGAYQMYSVAPNFLPSRRSISVAKVLESTTSRRGLRNNRSTAWGRTASLDRNTGKFAGDAASGDHVGDHSHCDRSGWAIRSTILDRTLKGSSEVSQPSTVVSKAATTTATITSASTPLTTTTTTSPSSAAAATSAAARTSAAIEALRQRSKNSNAVNVSESMRQNIGGSSATTFETLQQKSDFLNRFKKENDFSALPDLQSLKKSTADSLTTSGSLANSMAGNAKEKQDSSFSFNLDGSSNSVGQAMPREKSASSLELSSGRESLLKDASSLNLSVDRFESQEHATDSTNGTTISHVFSKEGKLMEIEELSEGSGGSVRARSPEQRDEEAAEFKERVVKAPEVPKELRGADRRMRRAVSSDLNWRSEVAGSREEAVEAGGSREIKRAESESNLRRARDSRDAEISRFAREEDGRRARTKVVIVREDEEVDEEFHPPIIESQSVGRVSSSRSQKSANGRKAPSRPNLERRERAAEEEGSRSVERIFSARVPKPSSGRSAVKVVWDEDGSVVRSGCSRVRHQPWEDNCWGNRDVDEALERSHNAARARYEEEEPGKVMVARMNGSRSSRQSNGAKNGTKNGVVIVRDPMVSWSRSAHQEDDEALGRTIHVDRLGRRGSSEDGRRGVQIVREPLAHRRSHIDFDNFDTLASSLTADIDALSPVRLPRSSPRSSSPGVSIVREPLARRTRTNSGDSVLSEHSLRAENDAILSALRLASSRDYRSSNWRDLSPEDGGVTGGWQESRRNTRRQKESQNENRRSWESRNENGISRESRNDGRWQESRSANGRVRESRSENGRSWESRNQNGTSRESKNDSRWQDSRNEIGGWDDYKGENGWQDSRFESRWEETRGENGWQERRNGNEKYHEQWIENGGWPESRSSQKSQSSRTRNSRGSDPKTRRSKSQPVTIVREPMAFRFEEAEREYDPPQPNFSSRKKTKSQSSSRCGPVTIIREPQTQVSKSNDWERRYEEREDRGSRSRWTADHDSRFVTFGDVTEERRYCPRVDDYDRSMASTEEQEQSSARSSTWNEDAMITEGASIYSDDPDIQEAYQVQQLVEKRFDHKAMLTELNVRLAKFVAQCRDLEANNRILVAQLESGKLGLSTAIVTLGARLQVELEEIKGLIVSSHACRLELTQRLDLLEEYYERKQAELEELELGGRGERAQRERLEEQVSAMEEEVMSLRERVAEYDDAVQRSEEDIIARLQQEEQELHKALTAEHAATQAARRQREILQQDMLEMRQQHLINKSEITVIGNESSEEKRRAWRAKFAAALRQLHDDYMAQLDQVHLEAERTFAEKLSQRSCGESDLDRSEASGIVSQLAAVNVRSAAQVDRLSSRIAGLTARIAQKEAELEALQRERSTNGTEHEERQKELKEELRGAKAELEKSKLMVARTIREKVSLSKEVESYRSVVESLRAQVQAQNVAKPEPELDDCAECERLRRIKSETSLRHDDTLCDSLLSSFHSQAGVYSAPKTPSHAMTQSCGLVMSTGSCCTSEALEPTYRSSEALQSTYRSSEGLQSTYRSSEALQSSHRSSEALQSSHRSSEALQSNRRSSRAVKPTFRTHQTVQPTYRSSKTVQPTYRTSKTIQPTYRSFSLPRGSVDMHAQEDFSLGTNSVSARSLGAAGGTRSWSRGGGVIY